MLQVFHDARFVGIMLLEEGRCAVFLRKVDGDLERILLSGVERLCVNDLREGNIVLDVAAYTGADASVEAVLEFLSIDLDKHRAFGDRIVARLHARELTFFQINPSIVVFSSGSVPLGTWNRSLPALRRFRELREEVIAVALEDVDHHRLLRIRRLVRPWECWLLGRSSEHVASGSKPSHKSRAGLTIVRTGCAWHGADLRSRSCSDC
jgi:hypothetical protein